MKRNCFNQLVLTSKTRLAMPIAMYPGLALTGATVRDIVTSAEAQVAAQAALYDRYGSPILLSAMDLSAEAEAFGCSLFLSEGEVPSVTGRLISSMEQAEALEIPSPGAKRTEVYIQTIRNLRFRFPHALVLAGCIGPFSLASRLVGVSEAMELTVSEPEMMHRLTEKCAGFLAGYARAFKTAGADGMIMAEPTAGLLSPRGMSAFSSAYIREINLAIADGRFAFILHNCAARLLHLPAILETGLATFHFGAPMDIVSALGKVAPEIVLCGNLDPAEVFCHSKPSEIDIRTTELLGESASYRNFVISSGCDVPPNAPLANLDAFFGAVRRQGGRS